MPLNTALLVFDEEILSELLLDVSKSGNPEAIDLLVKFAAERHYPFASVDIGRMLGGVAHSGNQEAIGLVLSLAQTYGLPIPENYFKQAMEEAVVQGENQAIKHIFEIATQREVEFSRKDFGGLLYWAAHSSDPQTPVLIDRMATAQEVVMKNKHWGLAMGQAAIYNNQTLEQVLKIITTRGIKLKAKYFITAMEHAASHYSSYAYIPVIDKQIELPDKNDKNIQLLVDLATKQGVAFSADDFSQVMGEAARFGHKQAVKQMFELAGEHGVMFSKDHFVHIMMRATAGEYPRLLRYTAKLADDYGMVFNGDDFLKIALIAMGHGIYDKIPQVIDLASKYHAKLEKKHFSQLMAASTASNNLEVFKTSQEEVDMLIKLATRYGISLDKEYFDIAITYATEENDHVAVSRLKELAHGFSG